MDKLYTIQEVATKLNVSDKTLRRWEEAGRFSPSRTLGNQRRYTLEDLQILDAIKHGTIGEQKDLLTVSQAGMLCGVSPTTILRWENDGKIHPFITSGNTYYPRQKLMEKMDELKNIYVEPNLGTVPERNSRLQAEEASSSADEETVPEGNSVPEGQTLKDILVDTAVPQGTVLKRNPRVQLEGGSRSTSSAIALEKCLQKGSILGGQQERTVPTGTIQSILINALITLVILLSYHLVINSSPSKPISPQTGSVQGVSTVAPDSRIDDLIVKFQDHLSAEMLQNARPINTTVKVESASLMTGNGTIPKGSNQISVTHDKIMPTTPVTATFTTDYAPAKKYWVIAEQGSFTLHTDFPVSTDSNFNYQFLAPDSTPSASGSPSATPKLTESQVKL